LRQHLQRHNAGAHGIKHFFAVIQPRNLGDKSPNKSKKNGLINANMSAIAAASVAAAPDSPPDFPLIVDVLVTTKKKTHINWGKGEHRDLLTKPFQIGSRRKATQLTNMARKFFMCMNLQTSFGSPRKLSTSISA
jgi:hypothetical protein